MANKILLTYSSLLSLFAFCGALHLFVPLYTRYTLSQPANIQTVASILLLDHCPLTASMINAFVIFGAVLVAIPALFLPQPRFRYFLVAHTYLVVGSALFTLAIGLDIWFSTLKTKANFEPVFTSQTTYIQSMLQYKFQCCGYDDASLFIQDTTCTSAAVAATLGGCVTPFSTYANKFLDIVFTTFFGFVAVDAMLLLSAFCLMKDRREKERYKLIDEKTNWGDI
jgi:hypothetical protein